MAIEFSIRIARPVVLSMLVESAANAFAELTGVEPPDLFVEIEPSGDGRAAPSDADFNRVRDPRNWSSVDDLYAVIRMREIDAACHLGLAAYVPLGRDPESGPFIYATSERTYPSFALTIAIAIGSARSCDSLIIDDSLLLGESRELHPDEAIERLEDDALGGSRMERIQRLTSRTRLDADW